MRRLNVAILALVVGGYSFGGESLVGKWAAKDRSNGLGMVLNFASDGIVTRVFGAVVDFKYEIAGQEMKMTLHDPGSGQTQSSSVPFKIADDVLTTGVKGSKDYQEMKRTTPVVAGAHPVVGVWTFKHYTGATATMQYTTTGLAQLCVPMVSTDGRYVMNGTAVKLEFSGEAPASTELKLEGDELTIVTAGNYKGRSFRKVVP